MAWMCGDEGCENCRPQQNNDTEEELPQRISFDFTLRELHYITELIDATAPAYGDLFNTKEFHENFEQERGEGLNCEQIGDLYTRLQKRLSQGYK